jgi:hypothetical protein
MTAILVAVGRIGALLTGAIVPEAEDVVNRLASVGRAGNHGLKQLI